MLNLRLISIALAISLILTFSYACNAQNKTTIDISSVGMGARPIALGGAYAGIADDASAIFINPAGLGLQKKMSFVSMSTQILTLVDYKVIGFSYPTENGTFAIGYVGASTPAGQHIYMSGGVTYEGGSMFYNNDMYILSYGCDISEQASDLFFSEPGMVKNLGFGVNLKYLSQGLSGSIGNAPVATGTELDFGLIYVPTDKLTVGATLQNIYRSGTGASLNWSSGENENLPSIFKLGCSYKALDYITVALDSDTDLSESNNTALHGGVEWQVVPYLVLRAGIEQFQESIDESEYGLVTRNTAGVGIIYDGMRFDYAYKQDPKFDEFSTHYFSFCFFGPEIEKPVEAEKTSFSQAFPGEETPVKETQVQGENKEAQGEQDSLSKYEELIKGQGQ